MTDRSEAKAFLGTATERSTARTEAPAYDPIALARDYLASALHPLSCGANRFVVSGGVTDGSMCDCGLTVARQIISSDLREKVGGVSVPIHPTVIQELVQVVPTWRFALATPEEQATGDPTPREWAEAREAAKKLSEANPGKTFRIYCAPHTYEGINHWGKKFVGQYEGGEQRFKDGFPCDEEGDDV